MHLGCNGSLVWAVAVRHGHGYNEIDKFGYIHKVIRKEAEAGENLLPKAHIATSLLKRWLLGNISRSCSSYTSGVLS